MGAPWLNEMPLDGIGEMGTERRRGGGRFGCGLGCIGRGGSCRCRGGVANQDATRCDGAATGRSDWLQGTDLSAEVLVAI